MKRIAALLGKEFVDLRLNPSVFLPAAIAAVAAVTVSMVVAVVVPHMTGESLSDADDMHAAIEMFRQQSGGPTLDPESTIQALIFQEVLMFLILVPVLGSTAAAAHSVVGEKEARTLEPLLATPLTTFELLAAKALAALLPALVLTVISFAALVSAVALWARPGVVWTLLTPRSVAVVFLIGPLAVLAGLQVAMWASSRASDERGAQQWGALVVIPIAALFVAPLLGVPTLTMPVILIVAVALVALNAWLMRLGIAVFDRESILTRWK